MENHLTTSSDFVLVLILPGQVAVIWKSSCLDMFVTEKEFGLLRPLKFYLKCR